jgi:hypothetical protein
MRVEGRRGSAKLKQEGRRGRAKLKSALELFESVFELLDLAGSKVRTPFGAGSSLPINLPVARPRSGIAFADANDSALATTIIGRYGVFIKPPNTVFPSDSHGKKNQCLTSFGGRL